MTIHGHSTADIALSRTKYFWKDNFDKGYSIVFRGRKRINETDSLIRRANGKLA